jgi:polyhydroxyalkanoate synthesis repressor PhaR
MLRARGGACPHRHPRGGRGRARDGKALHRLGDRRIGRRRGDMLLPQVEESPRQRFRILVLAHGLSSRGRAGLAAHGLRVHHARMTTTEKPDDQTASAAPAGDGKVVRVKKYANRRLYNTATSSYVTLEDLCAMVKQGTEFVVHDAKTGEDITRAVLTQIIVEEESKGGQNLLPIGFLRQLIAFYGDNLQSVVPRYLEASMQAFSHNQDQFRDSMKAAFGGFFPFGPQLEEMSKQNMALFQNAMSQVWAPFAQAQAQPQPGARHEQDTPPAAAPAAPSLDELRRQMEAIQRQLAEMARK